MKLVRKLTLPLAVVCLTWVGVLWWWQRSARVIGEVDLVVYLGLLPIVLLVLVFALRHAWRVAGVRMSAGLAVSPSSANAVEATGTSLDDAQKRYATLRLVHTALVSTGGVQACDLLEAAADGKPMPAPDNTLVNAAGLPVMCARLPDALLPWQACRAQLDTLVLRLGRDDECWQAWQPDDGLVRALCALQEPLLAQRQWLLGQALRHGTTQASPSAALPIVRLLLGCAAQWSAPEQTLTRHWAEALWNGDDADMASSYTLQILVVPGAGEDLWLKADQMAYATQTTSAPVWLLLAATHSDLDQRRIDAMAAAGQLYDAHTNPGGCMPGEAAAAVLIAPLNWSAPSDMAMPPVLLHRPALAQRSKPVEAAGKVDAHMLRATVSQALAAARLPADQLASLVCDADQHSQRATELYGMTISDLPQLDPLDDMRVLGKVSGNAGCASLLLVVACASASAQTGRKPVLALGMADSRLRLALVIQPDLPEDAAAQAGAAANRTS